MKSVCFKILKNRSLFTSFQVCQLRNLTFSKTRYYAEKYTLQLLPEIEKEIDDGHIKHRKHPGVRKQAPIVLPERLIKAAYNVIPDGQLKPLKLAAKELWHFLTFRRVPIEADEMQDELLKLYPSLRDDPEAIGKEELSQIRKKIYGEIFRWKPIDYGHRDCLIYLVARLAANYASISQVFFEIKSKLGTFQPKTFFDFGSGVGSGVWAAHSEFGDSLQEYFCVDLSSDMHDVAQSLLTDQETGEIFLKNIFFRQFLPASDTIKYDVVLSAFSLMELPSANDRLQVIDTLWRKTNDLLIVIEYGNKAGFSAVLDARDFILKVENQNTSEHICYSSGAHVIAPCPHNSACPKVEKRGIDEPCGFYVPYQSIFNDRATPIDKNDWISYVVLRKGHRKEGNIPWPRIVKPVLKRARHVHCRMCCSDGKMHEIIVTKAKHRRHAYRCVRCSTLGDLLPANIIPLPKEEDLE